MASQLEMLAQVLSAGTSPDKATRTQAEQNLHAARTQPGYGQALLQLLLQKPEISQMAAIEFKNLVKRQWQLREDEDVVVIADTDKVFIKQNILSILVRTPPKVQAQLTEALTLITSCERYPDQWPELIPELVKLMQPPIDLGVLTAVLGVANSVFEDFQHKFKSDMLFSQIKYVVETMGMPFLTSFSFLVAQVQEATSLPPGAAGGQTVESFKALYGAVLLAVKTFYSLNFQDFPEFFEDNLKVFMEGFHVLLTADSPLLHPQSEADMDTPTAQVKVHSATIDVLSLFLEKYDEEFTPYLQNLMNDVWGLLSKSASQTQTMFDPLVISGCKFLTTILTGTAHAMLGGQDVLKSVCEQIVIPNVQLREADEEMFEIDPDEFIRVDIEGSNLETRRRAAHDLVKGLTKYYEGVVTNIFTSYVGGALQQNFANEQQMCRVKDACMSLVTAVGAKGTTVAKGATEVNALVNILEFFKAHVVPELASPLEERPMLKAGALKFTATFRSHLSAELSQQIMQAAVALLKSESEVVHTYAANLVDKLLSMKNPQTNQPVYSRADVKPLAAPLLSELFTVIESGDENDYVMRAILRVCKIMQEDMVAHVEVCITKLKAIVQEVCKNPKKPMFNHYMFEVMACLIKHIVKSQPATADSFEGILFEPFQAILSEDVADFIPYVIQLMRLLLEVRPKPCPPVYNNQLPLFLNNAMYERAGNVPPLSALLQAYLRHMPEEVVSTNQLQPMLGVFQFLVTKRAHDHEGLWLLQAMFDFVPPQQLQPFMQTIFQILLNRLKASPTSKYDRNVCLAMLALCAKHGGTTFVSTLEGIQAGLAPQIINHVMVRKLASIVKPEQKRVASIGCIKLLCETPFMLENQAAVQLWPTLLGTLVRALEAESSVTKQDDEDEAEMAAIETAAASGQPGSTYAKLHFAAIVHPDPYAALPEAKAYLAQSLATLTQAKPGVLPPVLAADPDLGRVVTGYFQAIGAAVQ